MLGHGVELLLVPMMVRDVQTVADFSHSRFGPMLIGVFFNTMLYGVSVKHFILIGYKAKTRECRQWWCRYGVYLGQPGMF